MDNFKVVIIGGVHHNTLGVIRSLGEAGLVKNNIEVIIFEDRKRINNFISKSKYIDVQNIHYTCNEIETISVLNKISEDMISRVIICCSDASAEVVLKNQIELGYYFYTPTLKNNINDLMDKSIQGIFAKECGMNVPISIIYNKNEVLEWNRFPCITKPIKSTEGAGKADIKISRNINELKTNIEQIKSRDIQIQEYLEKDMEFQLIGCSLNCGQQLIIPGYTKLLRQPKNTNTGYLKYSPIEDLEFDIELVKRFVEKIGYSGLFSIEFIRDKQGKDYFLEINMRNDGNAYCVKTAGINLPYIWCFYNIHKTISNIPVSFRKPIYFIPDFSDVRLGIKEIGILRWFSQFIEAESHSLFSYDDPYPFIYELINRLKFLEK